MAFPRRGAGGGYVNARRAGRLVTGAATLLLLAAGVALAGSTESKSPRSQESRDQLKEVQRELGREREKVKEARRKEESLSRELSALEDDLKNKTRLLKDLDAKLRGSSQRITKLSRDIDVNDTRLQRSRALLRQRLRAMYKQGRMGYVGVLLSADDFSGAGRRLKYLSALAAQDQRMIKVYTGLLPRGGRGSP